MRLGVGWVPASGGSSYRAFMPMEEMARRGHDVLWPADADGGLDPRQVGQCNLVHVYRRHDERTARTLAELTRRGVTLTWDNDDDFQAISRDHPHYRAHGGMGGRRTFARMMSVAKLASVVTTTSEQIAERHRAAGVGLVEVIPNALARDAVRRPIDHEGIVIGWVAALEHVGDFKHVALAAALEQVMAAYPEVRVVGIGVDLGLTERYRYEGFVPFDSLAERIRRFDIALAPLADTPFNRARSDIKLKEYAACGVPWLASPVGPYRGLGEDEGGRLVPDDGWAAALEDLVRTRRARRALSKKGRRWAKRQTLATVGDRWEQTFLRVTAILS